MKESLRSQTSHSGNQASRPQPSGMSNTTTSQGSHTRRPKYPFCVEDLVFDEAGNNLLSSDKGYAAAKAAQAAQRAHATHPAQPLPQGPSAATRAENPAHHVVRRAPSNTSQNSNSGKTSKAYRDPNPSYIINEGPPMWTQPPAPSKSSRWNSAKIALLGEDSLWVDNGRDDWSDKYQARELARETRKTTTRETRDRSNSVTSILSGLKSGLKAAFGSSASLRSMQSGKSTNGGYGSYSKRETSPPPNPLYPDMNKKDWEAYHARSAKLKAKISKPIPHGPIFEADHIVAQQSLHEQSNRAQQPKPYRAKPEPRKSPSNFTIKTAEMKSFKEMKASPGGYIKHNDFQKHCHKPSIAREVVHPQSDWKLSVDKALENLHLRHKDSDESFSNSPVPPQMELQRVCNGCGKTMKKRGMGPYSAYMCDYCANKQKRKEREPIDTRPTNKDWADTRFPISPATDDGGPDRWAGRPITELYDDTDLSTLLTPDTIMQKRVLIRPASENQPTNPEDRYSSVTADLSSRVPPEKLHQKPRPFDTTTSALRLKPSERIHRKPQHTKSAFLHDMGNPFDRQTMVATPPVPGLPPPLPPKIPLKAPPGSDSKSAFKAVKAGRSSPLSLLTQENCARWEAMKADRNFAIPQTPDDMKTDVVRDTRFYDSYDNVLNTDSEKGSPLKRIGTAKGRK